MMNPDERPNEVTLPEAVAAVPTGHGGIGRWWMRQLQRAVLNGPTEKYSGHFSHAACTYALFKWDN